MRYLYIFACCLLLAAIVADGWGKTYFSKALLTTVHASVQRTDRDIAHAKATEHIAIGGVLSYAGLLLAALATVLWVASMLRERRFTLIPLALLVLYTVLCLIMV